MNRNQAVAIQIHADRYTIIGDNILITPAEGDVRRVKAQLTPNRDGDIAIHLTLIHPHSGPIDTLEATYGRNVPASRFAGVVDDYIGFWFDDQTGTHSEL
ncbi:hypothetical protein ACFWHQ_33450 [Streptomyces sp. NPDC060334]|uniref:hypothetical protein n=1 Tax=Streptomyces sp. NPDC060334 TaxID=3347099 RepID=UPI003669F985